VTTTNLRAREYLRVSFDRSGRQRSNDEQHADNLAAAAGFGVGTFAEPYRDVGSASKHARKRRDDFDRLLADLAAGRFDADLLMLWESSRGSRKVGEWVELIERCDAAGVRIGVTTHGRVYDPANARDRRMLLEDAVDGEYESSKVSLRTRRAAAAAAADGRPHGAAPYGYKRVRDPATGRVVAQVPHPTEAPIIAEAFERIAAGHSLRSVAADLAARGVQGRRGRPISPSTLRPMLLSPTYIGQRLHAPGSTSRSDRARCPTATITEATWDGIVSEATFHAVRHRLTDPARRTSRPGRGVHLLSMIARCDVCAGTLAATFRREGRREYACRTGGHVRIPADPLDAWAEQQIIGVLTDRDRIGQLVPTVDDAALDAARDDAARVQAELDDLGDAVGRGELLASVAARAQQGIAERLRAARQRVDDLSTPAGLQALIEPGDLAEEQWAAAPMSAKRDIVRLLFRPGLLGELSVARATDRGPIWPRIRLDGHPITEG
jgi:site-specific DNA recombinase